MSNGTCFNNKKIALFVPSMDGGGAERVMCTLAGCFSKLNYSVDLVLARAEGPYLKSLPLNVNVINLNRKRVLFCLPSLVRYIRKQRPEVMLSTLDHANMVAVWAKKLSLTSMRIIVRESTAPSEDFKNGNNKIAAYLTRLLVMWCYKMADGVIAVSEGVKNDLIEFFRLRPSQVQVIHNPVVSSRVLEYAQAVPSHPWFKEGEPPVVLGVGRLSREKDFASLIKAFALARREISARLIILGEGEERENLEKLIDKTGFSEEINLAGFVDNPYSYMKYSSVYVLSSVYEGLPNTLIQAMAVGTPVISTNCRYGPSEILNEKIYGKLVKIGDYEAIANEIISCIKTGKKNSKEFVDQLKRRSLEFSEDPIVSKYEKYLLN